MPFHPRGHVRTRVFRARAMLRASLAEEMDIAATDVFRFDGARCDRIVAGVRERLHVVEAPSGRARLATGLGTGRRRDASNAEALDYPRKNPMKTLLTAAAASLALVAGVASAQSPNDAQIASIVVTANQVDIDAGKLAESKGSNAEVKAFGKQMVTDHSGVNKQAVALVT